jgi:hypothetical protein
MVESELTGVQLVHGREEIFVAIYVSVVLYLCGEYTTKVGLLGILTLREQFKFIGIAEVDGEG